MEYPGAKFVKPIRRVMLILFVSAFFILSPTVILYSAGYRYDFRNGLLRETGSLSVDVFPKTAVVYLDGLKLDGYMPVRLNNITPHKYTVKISAPGYYDWEKQIEINKNQTTYIKEFYLLKRDKPVLLSRDKAENLSFSPSSRYIAYSVKDKNQTRVMLFNTKTNTSSLVLLVDGTKPLKLTWSSTADYLAVAPEVPPFKTLNVVNADTPSKVRTLTTSAPHLITKFFWGKNNEPEIYYGDGSGIWSFLPRLQQNSFITSSTPYQDWYIDDGTLWAIKYNTTTQNLRITEDTLGFKTNFADVAATDSESTSTLLFWKFETVEHGTVVLSNGDNNFLIVRADKNYLINARKYRFSKFNNWWLFWSDWELWSYSENDEPYLLNRSGAELRDVQSLDQYNTLALTWNNDVTALYPYYFIEQKMIGGQIISMATNPTTRVVYFGDASGFWKQNY